MKTKKKEKDPRVPRPLGFTYQAIQYHNEPDTQKKKQIKKTLNDRIIDLYTNTGMQLNGRLVPIGELATYLDLPLHYVIKRINKGMEQIGNMLEGDNGRQLARVAIFNTLNWVQQGRVLAENQVHILSRSQGRKYKPFISGELNRAIANLTGTTKPALDLIKLLTDNPAANPIINNTDNSVQNNLYVTAEMATQLINNKQHSVLTDSTLLEAAYQAEKADEATPEVVAIHQDLRGIGLRHDGTQNKAIEATKEPHEARRERDEAMEVLDPDDFKV